MNAVSAMTAGRLARWTADLAGTEAVLLARAPAAAIHHDLPGPLPGQRHHLLLRPP